MSIELTDQDKVNIKIAYLDTLQNIINRMATFSLAMKTASITTLTALLAYSASEPLDNSFKLWMFFIPWLFFAWYHAYFLRLERAFRHIYNNSSNQNSITFDDMKIDGNKLNNAYEKWTSIIFSKPLFFFHLTLITIAVVSFINIKGIPCF
ncbi:MULTISPECIES: hypothetical protein [unclassified Psychrobacter]|uniref:hypothetical protein n=1 Tax=unclassified Psychrobacter TaxID=196806 RepID=UPI0015996AB1|nr:MULTISPECIES: hypothetical protein [unclassified Psychrobacter]QJS05905.1 nohypothetical protein ne [Psychrobacter sp.]